MNNKCHFCIYEVEALRHKIPYKRLLPIEKKVDAIQKLENPTIISELRSFLGMRGYYRNFINKYAPISAPICKLLKKNTLYLWIMEHPNNFNSSKDALCVTI